MYSQLHRDMTWSVISRHLTTRGHVNRHVIRGLWLFCSVELFVLKKLNQAKWKSKLPRMIQVLIRNTMFLLKLLELWTHSFVLWWWRSRDHADFSDRFYYEICRVDSFCVNHCSFFFNFLSTLNKPMRNAKTKCKQKRLQLVL